jgi:hypothetical protein
LAVNKLKGTKLKVFSGKEASLNLVILLILREKTLIPYDVWLLVKATKDFRHTPYKSVCRRMQALEQQSWITKSGKRLTKPAGVSDLYQLTLKAEAALRLAEKTIDGLLETATDEQLLHLIQAFK